MSLRFMESISVSRKQKKPHISVKLCSVIPLVQNSNSFLEDLRRLNQLKDISIRNNGASKESENATKDKPQQKGKVYKSKR